jgi:hypothetical protein
MVDPDAPHSDPPGEELTARELEVLDLRLSITREAYERLLSAMTPEQRRRHIADSIQGEPNAAALTEALTALATTDFETTGIRIWSPVSASTENLQRFRGAAEAIAILDRIESELPALEERTQRLMQHYGL